jgi:hypothetical protein
MGKTWFVPPSRLDAWEALPSRTIRVGGFFPFVFPEPRIPEMESLVQGLLSRSLATKPRAEIIAAIGRTARRFLEDEIVPDQSLDYIQFALPHPREMVRASMRHLFREWASPAAVDRALGDFAGGFAGFRDGRRAAAPRLTYHVLAGNVPWAGVDSLFAATLVGSASLVKLSSQEPSFTGLVAQVLAGEDSDIAEAIAVLHWPRGSHAVEEVVLQGADAVVAFGDNASVAAYAGRLAHRIASGQTRFVPRGHRISAAIVGPGGDHDDVAEGLALDVTAEEQKGCLSPHAVYLVGMSEPERFAERLAAALERYEQQWRREWEDAGLAASVQQERAAAEFAGARVIAPEDSTTWTVIVDRSVTFTPVPTARFARLRIVDSLEQAIAALLPARGLLSTIGVAGFEDAMRAADQIASLAPGRICPVGRMQRPPAGWNHEGASDAAALLQWIEWEGE